MKIADFNDLSYDLTIHLLNFLPDKELFRTECVSKKWQHCIRKILRKRVTHLDLKHFGNTFTRKASSSSLSYLPDHYYGQLFEINDNNITILKNILSRCPRIKSWNWRNTQLNGSSNLLSIACLCPNLESIIFNGLMHPINTDQWDKFAKCIGAKLINCNFNRIHNNSILTIFFKRFQNIEKIAFGTQYKEEDKELFGYLKACNNLKSLKWRNLRYYQAAAIQEHKRIKHVVERVNELEIDLGYFIKLKPNVNNLTQLILSSSFQNSYSQITGTFDSLTYLKCINFRHEEFESFTDLKFPNLKACSLDKCMGMNPSFIRSVSTIKSITFKRTSFDVVAPVICSLRNIIHFQFLKGNLRDQTGAEILNQLLVELSKHKSIRKIKIDFRNDNRNNASIEGTFKKIVDLAKEKPDVDLKIVFPNHQSLGVVNLYKVKFAEMKRASRYLTNIRIENLASPYQYNYLLHNHDDDDDEADDIFAILNLEYQLLIQQAVHIPFNLGPIHNINPNPNPQ